MLSFFFFLPHYVYVEGLVQSKFQKALFVCVWIGCEKTLEITFSSGVYKDHLTRAGTMFRGFKIVIVS